MGNLGQPGTEFEGFLLIVSHRHTNVQYAVIAVRVCDDLCQGLEAVHEEVSLQAGTLSQLEYARENRLTNGRHSHSHTRLP